MNKSFQHLHFHVGDFEETTYEDVLRQMKALEC